MSSVHDAYQQTYADSIEEPSKVFCPMVSFFLIDFAQYRYKMQFDRHHSSRVSDKNIDKQVIFEMIDIAYKKPALPYP